MKGTGLKDITDDGDLIYAPFEYNDTLKLGSPIRTRALFLDGYYLFNKKCSYAAAYDQSVIQKRSAGSLMAGAMYFHSTTKYDDDINADLIMLMNDIGVIKTWQVSAGAGYIYNWVPAKGWLVSGMVMPMLTFYSRIKSYTYDITTPDGRQICDLSDPEYYHLFEDEEAYRSVVLTERGVSTTHNKLSWNFDARLSVVYNWSRTYMRVYGYYNRFRYDNEDSNGRLTEWHVYASLGYRF